MALATTPYGNFYYFAPDTIGQNIAVQGFWDVHNKMYFDTLSSGDTLIDIGASIGFYTVYSALRGIKVHAFEPSPEVFDLLRRNVELNHVQDNVVLYRQPLYDKEVELWMEHTLNQYTFLGDGTIDYENNGNSSVLCLIPKELGEKPCDKYKFVTKTLDSYNIQFCNLLKIDTQGADLRVLYGAKETIKRCRPIVLYEHEPCLLQYHGDKVEGFEEFFRDFDYNTPVYVGGVDYVVIPR